METVTRSVIPTQRSLGRIFAFLRRFDGRALLMSAGLAVVACLPLGSTLPDRREEYLFDITLTSTTDGYTRVLWDNGHGFNEHDSSIQPLRADPKPVTYRYLLPYGQLKALRFVPLDRAGVVTLTEARVSGLQDRIVRRFRPTDFVPGRDIRSIRQSGEKIAAETVGSDQEPYFEVKLDQPLRLKLSARAAWRMVAPIVLGALAIGLLLASPVRTRVVSKLVPLLAWCPAHPRSTIVGLAAVAVLWQAHPVVFEGRSFVSPANGSLMLYGDLPTVPGSKQKVYADGMGSDTGAMLFQHLYYPMIERTALVRDHELPLWNRSSLCGVPLLGQGQSMAGDPLNLLTILANGASWAWDLRFLVARWLLVAGLAMTAWQLTRNLPAALLTAIGASFLGFFTFRLDHPANFTLGYAPWLLVAWIALAQARSAGREYAALGLLLVAHGVEFCSGTVKEAVVLIVMLDLAGAGLVGLSPESDGRRVRRLVGAIAVGGLFTLLAAPFWWSFLDALGHSYTRYDVPHAGQLPLRELIGLFDDIFYRQNSAEEWVVAPSLNFLFLGGLLAWVVCPAAWTRTAAALALTAAVSIGFGFGIVPARWIEAVPFLGNVNHVGNEFSCVLVVLLVPLAAIGFTSAARAAGEAGWWARSVAALLVLAALVGAWYASPERVGASLFCRGYGPALGLALVALAIALRWRASAGRAGTWWVACTLALPILLWRHGQYADSVFNHYVFVPGERVDVHGPSAAVHAIDAQSTEPSRVVGFGTNLFPGYPAALGWESLYGVDALRSPYYGELALALHLERVWQWDQPDREADAAQLQPARDALNVRYSLADHRDASRTLGTLQRATEADLDVYVSPTAWPRAFFTDRMARYGSADDFAQLIRKGDGRPFAAIQIGETDAPALPSDLAHRAIRPATAYRLTANTTQFTIDAPTAGVAVLTETYYPGDFRVKIDGRPEPYFRVNHAFKGVAITRSGRHEIVVSYWPRHFFAALALCAIGWVLLGVAAWWGVRDARRVGAFGRAGVRPV